MERSEHQLIDSILAACGAFANAAAAGDWATAEQAATLAYAAYDVLIETQPEFLFHI